MRRKVAMRTHQKATVFKRKKVGWERREFTAMSMKSQKNMERCQRMEEAVWKKTMEARKSR
jgi:hypothetical protein